MLLHCVAKSDPKKRKPFKLGPDYFVVIQVLSFLTVLMRCYEPVIED